MKRHILLNPFAHFAEIQLVAAGLLATAVGSFLGWQCNTRFDGVLDLHFVSQTTPWQPLLDNGINLLCLVIPLYLVGRSINSKTRLIDLVSTALVARIPYYVLPLTNTGGFMHLASMNLVENATKGAPIGLGAVAANIAFAALAIVATVVFIYWLFQGFQTATNSKKNLHKWIFGGCIVLSEVISKLLILSVN